MKLSIIMPVFNSENHLKKSINSVINQGIKNIELIIINDGSIDNSIEIIKYYANKYSNIKYVSQKNSGVSNARNKGIEIAKGDYIGFIDPDDYFVNDSIKNIFLNIEKYNPDIIFFDLEVQINNSIKKNYIKTDKKILNNINKNEFKKYILNIPRINLNSVDTKFFKKDLIKKFNLKFNANLKMGEDASFSYKFIQVASSFSIYNITAYHYSDTPDSLTKKTTFNTFKQKINSIKEYNNLMINLNIDNKFINTHVINTFFSELKFIITQKINYKIKFKRIKLMNKLLMNYNLINKKVFKNIKKNSVKIKFLILLFFLKLFK